MFSLILIISVQLIDKIGWTLAANSNRQNGGVRLILIPVRIRWSVQLILRVAAQNRE